MTLPTMEPPKRRYSRQPYRLPQVADTPEAVKPISDAEKEQIKLRATYLNQIAGNLIIVGVFAPLATVFYAGADLVWETAFIGFGVFFVTSSILHIVAQLILRRLK